MSVSLRSLSDSDILSRTQSLTARERKLTLLLLLHLNEIERRKLHLKEGYSSMFDYCTSGLGYSEPSAFRRICTARCVARFPEVHELLRANQVNLTTITRVSRVLTPTNKEALLARVRGRPLREVDAIVAEYQPRRMPRDVVRPAVVRVSGASVATPGSVAVVPAGVLPLGSGTPNRALGTSDLRSPVTRTSSQVSRDHDCSNEALDGACENNTYFRREGDFHPPASADRIALEKRIQFQFTTTHAFQQKLEKVKTLAWHRLPANPSLEQVFELALDVYIEKHDPNARRSRRHEGAQDGNKQPTATPNPDKGRTTRSKSRYIAAATKDEVFVRDEGQCNFIGATGRRCASKTALQVDHIEPFARGGSSTVENLRLLCAYHNRLEAERLMGCITTDSSRRSSVAALRRTRRGDPSPP